MMEKPTRGTTFDLRDLSDLQDAAAKFKDTVDSVIWTLRELHQADAELTAALMKLRAERGAK
jgi:hypothetical protein